MFCTLTSLEHGTSFRQLLSLFDGQNHIQDQHLHSSQCWIQRGSLTLFIPEYNQLNIELFNHKFTGDILDSRLSLLLQTHRRCSARIRIGCIQTHSSTSHSFQCNQVVQQKGFTWFNFCCITMQRHSTRHCIGLSNTVDAATHSW